MTAAFRFVEQILTKFAQNASLDETFDRNTKYWTQSLKFMNAIAKRALAFCPFVRPVAKSIRKITLKTYVIDGEMSPRNFSFFFPKTPSLSSQLLDDKPYGNRKKTRKVETKIILNVVGERKSQTQGHTRKFYSSSSSMNPLKLSFLCDRESLILNQSKMFIDRKARKARSAKPHLPLLQTVEK